MSRYKKRVEFHGAENACSAPIYSQMKHEPENKTKKHLHHFLQFHQA